MNTTRLVALLFLLGVIGAHAASLDLVETGTYGIDDIRLSNTALELTISPHRGARILSLKDKRNGRDYAFFNGSLGGILHALHSGENYPGELRDATFKYEIVAQHPQRVAVRLFTTIAKGEAGGVVFSKTLTLYEDVPAVFVNLELKNDSFLSRHVSLRLHNWTQLPDSAGGQTILPTAQGPIALTQAEKNLWYDEVPATWLARLDHVAGGGIAFHTDYDATARLLSYQPQTPGLGATCEWAYRPLTLRHGDSWKTQVQIIPFLDLTSVSHVSSEQVYQLQRDEEQLTVDAYSVRDRTVEVALTVAGGEPLAADGELQAGTITRFEFPTPVTEAPYQLSLRAHGIRQDITTTLADERPETTLPIPAKGDLQIERTGTARIEITRSAAPPYRPADAPRRILVLSTWWFANSSWSRDFPGLLKLSQATRHSYEWLFSRTQYTKRWAFRSRELINWLLRDDPRFQVDLVFEDDYADYLPKLYDYDLLVLNDFPGAGLAPYVDELSEYVRSGGGLLVLGGYASYGGRGTDYGSYRGIESLLPVEIPRAPDWMSQTPYPAGEPGWGGGIERLIQLPGMSRVRSRCGPVLNIHDTMDWITDGDQLQSGTLHPVTAGIPLGTLAPSYHAVNAKPGATSLATIADHDVITAARLGEGRQLAIAISDPRRLYFWEHTGQVITQAAEWLCGLEPEQVIYRLEAEPGGLAIQVGNLAPEPASSTLQVTVRDASGHIWLEQDQPLTLEATSHQALSLTLSPDLPPGRFTVTASLPEHRARTAFTVAALPGLSLTIRTPHERTHFVRGEPLPIELQPDGLPAGKSMSFQALLVPENGGPAQPVAEGPLTALTSFELATESLAYGRYALTVSILDAEKVVLRQSTALTLNKAVDPAFPVFIYDLIPAPRVWPNTYVSLAYMDRIAEDYNLAFSVRWTSPATAPSPGADHALHTSLALMQVPARTTLTMERAEQGFRDPDALAALTKQVEGRTRHLAPYPAIIGSQLDDEGAPRSYTALDQRLFQETYGYPMPVDEIGTLSQRVDLANYHLQSGTAMWTAAAEASRAVRPDLIQANLQTIAHTPAIGGWLWDNFRNMDVALIDLYPPDLGAIGYQLLYLNLLRSVQNRLQIPGWVLLGEYRNDFASMKMQYWLTLGAGVRGYGWYYTGYSTGTGIYRREWEWLKPYQQIALDYGPLLAAWEKPDSPIAVLYSKAALSYRDEALVQGDKTGLLANRKAYSNRLETLFHALYRHDLYADIITEDDLRDGRADQYQAILVIGADELEPDIREHLQEPGQIVMAADNGFPLEQAQELDLDLLAKRFRPFVISPDPGLITEHLQAAGLPYLVVYNHHQAETVAKLQLASAEPVVVYDLVRRQRWPVTQIAEQPTTVELPLPAVEGTVLALLPGEITSLDLTGPATASTGTPWQGNMSLHCDQPISGLTPVRLTVHDPRGVATPYGHTLCLRDGRATFTIPFATNDLVGTWDLHLTDLITGKTTQHAIELAHAPIRD